MKQIKVAGQTIKILFKDDMESLGEYHGARREIWLKAVLREKDSDKLKSVLLHELMHAVFEITGLSWSAFKSDEELEEGIVRGLEHALYPILKDIVEFNE